MPVTGLYFCPDSGTTQAPALSIIDRLSKRYQPVYQSKWTLEHRLLRENGPTGPLQPGVSPQSQQPSASGAPSTGAPGSRSTNSPLSASQPRFMQYLDLSHHPGKKFCLVDKTIVTIDAEFEQILVGKLQGLWGMRQTLKAEGNAYDLEDFRIRIATLSQGSMIKGVLVEVEYLPCSYVEQGEVVIRDFIDQLELPQGPTVKLYFSQAARVEGDESKEFSVLDTGMQYMELLRLRG
ncbi:hypothetical protein ABW19_dt0210407 [Dactylella cylindrospora]|nr:hypothetical protein ABW19_dt0210407 [Dactylella cylindrospora]